VRKNALTMWFDHLRTKPDSRAWLLLHAHGEYEFRNPDSLYVHRFETFATEEAARYYLEQRIAPADRDEWQLYAAIPYPGDK